MTFTPEHARQLRFVRRAGFTSDGRDVFYTVTEIDEELRERDSLWLFNLDAAKARRLADELDDVASPSPSPDGASLAVLAEVDGKQQILLVPLDGGKLEVLTSVPQGVTGPPVWSPDGRSIAFTAGPTRPRDPALPYWVDRPTYRAEPLGNLDDAVTDLYVVDVETAVVRQLTDDRCMNSDPRWSPDGRALSYLVSFRPDRVWALLPELHVLEVDGGTARPVVDTWGGVFASDWCADGTQLVFIGTPARGEVLFTSHEGHVWTVDAAGGEPQCRTTTATAGMGLPVLSTDLPTGPELSARLCVHGDSAYVNGQVGGHVAVYRVALHGPETVDRLVATDGCAFLVDVRPDRGVLHFATSFVEPPELVLRSGGSSNRITALNDELLGMISRPTVQKLAVTAPDGLQTEAWALTPPGDGPWPTVLHVHGGPWAAIGSVFMIDLHLLVGAGFAVVTNNFRGSGGYGTEFSQQIVGDWGGNASLDHHATVDEAIRAGIADPDRLGVFGISHGGFATCWLLGTSDRFKAGVAENGATSFTTFFGVTDSEWWMAAEFGGTPWEVPDVYRDRSPLTYASTCTTPLLFIIGEADLCCHPIESEQFYRVLKTNGVPTRMLRLPNGSHGASRTGPVPARIAQNEALIAWFAQHLVTSSDSEDV